MDYHNDIAIEIVINKSHDNHLIELLYELDVRYECIITNMIEYLTTEESALKERNLNIKNTLNPLFYKDVFLEGYFLGDYKSIYATIKLNNMSRLETDFGKSNTGLEIGYLNITFYGERDNADQLVADFIQEIRKILKRVFRLNKLPNCSTVMDINAVAKNLQDKYASFDKLGNKETDLCTALLNKDYRSVAMSMSALGNKSTLETISKSLGIIEDDVRKILNSSKMQKHLKVQYKTSCQSCQYVVAIVPKLNTIKAMISGGVKCPNCGNALKNTKITKVYILKDYLKNLLMGSTWLSCIVATELLDIGCSKKRMFVELKDGINEIDILADYKGNLILAELKDNRFSMGHAYSFAGKCTQYKPDIPIIIASEGIDGDVKEYLSKVGINAKYIDSLANIEERLNNILSATNVDSLNYEMKRIDWDSRIALAISMHSNRAS